MSNKNTKKETCIMESFICECNGAHAKKKKEKKKRRKEDYNLQETLAQITALDL